MATLFVCLLLFYVLPTSKVFLERVPTCDSALSWLLYSAAPLRDQVANTMTYPTQSHYDYLAVMIVVMVVMVVMVEMVVVMAVVVVLGVV